MKSKHSAHPDLQSQFESMLDQVWRSEDDWRLWDRVDAFVMLDSLRAKRDARRALEAVSAEGLLPESTSENAA